MKKFIFALVVCQAMISTYAQYSRVELTKHATTYTDKYEDLFVFIPGLENDLFREFKVKSSRGPKWQGKAIDQLYDVADFHERSSYIGERYSGECDEYFQEGSRGATDTDEIYVHFEWQAVKRLKGSSKSVMYIVRYYTQLYGDQDVNGSRECNILEDEYVFLNKVDSNGKPVYLGQRTDSVPRGI